MQVKKVILTIAIKLANSKLLPGVVRFDPFPEPRVMSSLLQSNLSEEPIQLLELICCQIFAQKSDLH